MIILKKKTNHRRTKQASRMLILQYAGNTER